MGGGGGGGLVRGAGYRDIPQKYLDIIAIHSQPASTGSFSDTTFNWSLKQ